MKLQQGEVILDGVALDVCVGAGVGILLTSHLPGEHASSQVVLFELQKSPTTQFSPLSKLQQEGISATTGRSVAIDSSTDGDIDSSSIDNVGSAFASDDSVTPSVDDDIIEGRIKAEGSKDFVNC